MTRIDPLSRALQRHAGRHGPVMLMYHAVVSGKARPAWPWAISMQQFRDQLDFLVSEGYATPTQSELVATPEKWSGRTAVITFDDGYANNLGACDELLKRSMRASWFIVTGSIGQSPLWADDGRPKGKLLNVSELREMHAAGMEIGSHTDSHVRLTETDDAHLQLELNRSRAALEDVLGEAVTSFAYPYGAWDKRCADAVKLAGYASACTTQTGWALRDNNPYRLRRLSVFNHDTLGRFVRKLAFASHAVSWTDMLRYARSRFL